MVLRVQLALLRHGRLAVVAWVLLVVGAVLHGIVLPQLYERTRREQEDLQRQIRAVPAPDAPSGPDEDARTAQTRYEAFRAVLYAESQLPRLIETVFAQAQRHRLVLAQADYRRGNDREGDFGTLEMRLPIRGAYGDIRRFIADLLLAAPGAALKDVRLRRDSIAVDAIEADIGLVFYLRTVP